jgi:hypothetical protein
MRGNRVQLAWPFALLGIAAGSQLPAGIAGGVTMAVVLGFVGALISTGLDRVHDWQVALMAPLVGATTGATIGFLLDGFDAGAVGIVAGTGFGLLALPPLVLITDAARRACRTSPRSIVGRGQRRRLWLMTAAAAALASLIVPALTNPWARPAESPLAQLLAVTTMLVALVDAMAWLATASPRARQKPSEARHPYREPGLPSSDAPDDHARALAHLTAHALVCDAFIVAVVAAALVVSP